jgi:hypothetical protein
MTLRTGDTTGQHARTPAPVDPLFDPGDPALMADPYPMYRRLREADPVHWSPLGAWVLSRYADVDAVQRDGRFDRGLRPCDPMLARFGGAGSPVAVELGRWMLHRDPPDHTRLRRLVTAAFRYTNVRTLRSRIQGIVDDLLDGVAGRGRMDVVADIAYPLPVAVVSDLLGLPIEDHTQRRVWAEAITQVFHPVQTAGTLDAAALAIEEASAYIRTRVEARRRDLRDDLLSSLIAAEEDGDRLGEGELVSTVNLLLFAGHETTRNLIGNAVLALLRHPAELERLREQPGLAAGAVEEFLRYDSPVQSNRRIAREEVELEGIRIQPGQSVHLLIGAAHRDPERFAEPDRLDVARRDVRPLSFGGGIHFCVGAPLARMETEIVISSLLRRLGDLELAVDEPVWRSNAVLRGLVALPVTFRPS